MATPSGISGQIGWKPESTYGTEVVVDQFLPFRSEGFEDEYQRSIADDIVAGAQTERQDQVRASNKAFSGTVGLYLFNKGMVELFRQVLGGDTATTGSDPYDHVVSPGDLTGRSLTMQVGRPDVGGTMRAFTYFGCKAQRLGLAVTAGEYATVDFDVIAQDADQDTTLATASMPAGLVRYHADDMTVTIGGDAVCVRNLDLELANALDDTRRCVGSSLIKEPLRNDLLAISGSVEIEWSDLTHYNRVKNMTNAALVVGFDNGTDTFDITMQARFDAASQPVAGRGVVYQTLSFMASGASTDANTFSATFQNDDAAGD